MTDGTPIWFITGSSSGLGRALAQAVLERGWRAVLTARRLEGLADLASEHGDRALTLQLDVTENTSIARAVADAQAHFGHIDVLVNNAGYGYLAAIEEGEDEGVRAQFETNVFGLLAVTKRVLPGMRGAGAGTSSIYPRWVGSWHSPPLAITTPPSSPWRRSPSRSRWRWRRSESRS